MIRGFLNRDKIPTIYVNKPIETPLIVKKTFAPYWKLTTPDIIQTPLYYVIQSRNSLTEHTVDW